MAGFSCPDDSPLLLPLLSKEQKLSNQENDDLDLDKLISSLPKNKGSVGPALILYRNFWCPSKLFPSVHSFCRCFVAADSDIILASWPKSGTTWLNAFRFATLCRNVFPPSSSDHKAVAPTDQELAPFFQFTIYGKDGELIDMACFPTPRLFATHIPYDSLPESIRQYTCRCSMEEFVDYYCRGIGVFGPFYDNTLGYWKASLEKPNKVLFLKYEDTKEGTDGNLKRIAEFMEVPFLVEEESDGMIQGIVKLCSLNSLKELEVNNTGKSTVPYIENSGFFRIGDVGDWVSHLTPIVEKLKKSMEEKLSPHGLKFRVN